MSNFRCEPKILLYHFKNISRSKKEDFPLRGWCSKIKDSNNTYKHNINTRNKNIVAALINRLHKVTNSFKGEMYTPL